MANAKLDDDFKEEMAAIEQWFKYLSECERTTVLYSLIQNISELQVRFFLTLLQQRVKNNPLYNSMIKGQISESIYSSSTKHCSNTSSENSSMINSTSNDTCYDDEEYQKSSFVDTSLQNNANQFACPLNLSEYNIAINSLSNVNFLNERSSSLASQSNKNRTHNTHPQSQPPTPSTPNSRKNSYMGSMMSDFQTFNTTPSPQITTNAAANLNVLRDMNRYSESAVLLNTMTNSPTTNPTMMNQQFLPSPQQTIMVNNNTSLYSNSSNNIPLLNQTTINSIINPNPLTLLNGNNGNPTNSTSALPVLSPKIPSNQSSPMINPITPMISPISPPKSTSNRTPVELKSEPLRESHNSKILTELLLNAKEEPPKVFRETKIFSEPKEIKEPKEPKKVVIEQHEPEPEKPKELSKNATILSNILSLSKEMNDMVNKSKEKKKEKQAKSPTTPIPITPTAKPKKPCSEDGESTISPPSVEGITTSTTVTPIREKGKIPDQIDLESLEDIPTFLRSLRLHKYQPAFEGMTWKQMIKLKDEELLKRGVSALGARNKMLKVFDLIRAEAIKQGVSLDC